jgi:hypothetical protein
LFAGLFRAFHVILTFYGEEQDMQLLLSPSNCENESLSFFFSGMPTDLSWELVLFRASMKRRGKWKGFLLALAKLCPEALRNLSRGLGNAAQGLSTCLA